MFTTQINLRTLKAVSLAASTEQARYYLCGVKLECRADHVRYIATNGHVLLAAREDLPKLEPGETRLTGDFIIPTDACRPKLARGDSETVTMSAETKTAARATLGDRIVTLIDGSFPDWARIIPAKPAVCEHTHFDPKYVKLMGDFAKGMSLSPSEAVIQPGAHNDPHAVTFGAGTYFGIIMPMRTHSETWNGLPSWATDASPEPESIAAE